jgi:hypothetical protein
MFVGVGLWENLVITTLDDGQNLPWPTEYSVNYQFLIFNSQLNLQFLAKWDRGN